jgi:hypothetical protein
MEEGEEMRDDIQRFNELAAEVFRLVPPSSPEPPCWLESDAGPSYCSECVRIAHAKELGLPSPLAEPPSTFSWLRSEDEDAAHDRYEEFEDGISYGWLGMSESDTPEHCDTCGKMLAYSLTEYGFKEEAEVWPQCKISPVGAGWHPDASYALDRWVIYLSWGDAPAEDVAVGITVATDALATTL